jgi:hypothetical protein
MDMLWRTPRLARDAGIAISTDSAKSAAMTCGGKARTCQQGFSGDEEDGAAESWRQNLERFVSKMMLLPNCGAIVTEATCSPL